MHLQRQFDNRIFSGREAATRMSLVDRIDRVKGTTFDVLNEHPVKCKPVKIRLSEKCQRYSLSTARSGPIPMLAKVKEELSRMEKIGIIEEIYEPTDWCASMVTVLKKPGWLQG